MAFIFFSIVWHFNIILNILKIYHYLFKDKKFRGLLDECIYIVVSNYLFLKTLRAIY